MNIEKSSIRGGFRCACVLLVCTAALLSCARAEKQPRATQYTGPRGTVAQPEIISPGLWTSDLPTGRFASHSPDSILVFDEKVVTQSGSQSLLHLRQRQIQSMNEKKWGEIPFHYYIDSRGVLYEGRPVDHQAPSLRHNHDPRGQIYVAFINDFDRYAPSKDEMETLVHLLCWLCNKYSIPVDRIEAIREGDPNQSAGKRLQAYFDQGLIQERVRNILAKIEKQS